MLKQLIFIPTALVLTGSFGFANTINKIELTKACAAEIFFQKKPKAETCFKKIINIPGYHTMATDFTFDTSKLKPEHLMRQGVAEIFQRFQPKNSDIYSFVRKVLLKTKGEKAEWRSTLAFGYSNDLVNDDDSELFPLMTSDRNEWVALSIVKLFKKHAVGSVDDLEIIVNLLETFNDERIFQISSGLVSDNLNQNQILRLKNIVVSRPRSTAANQALSILLNNRNENSSAEIYQWMLTEVLPIPNTNYLRTQVIQQIAQKQTSLTDIKDQMNMVQMFIDLKENSTSEVPHLAVELLNNSPLASEVVSQLVTAYPKALNYIETDSSVNPNYNLATPEYIGQILANHPLTNEQVKVLVIALFENLRKPINPLGSCDENLNSTSYCGLLTKSYDRITPGAFSNRNISDDLSLEIINIYRKYRDSGRINSMNYFMRNIQFSNSPQIQAELSAALSGH